MARKLWAWIVAWIMLPLTVGELLKSVQTFLGQQQPVDLSGVERSLLDLSSRPPTEPPQVHVAAPDVQVHIPPATPPNMGEVVAAVRELAASFRGPMKRASTSPLTTQCATCGRDVSSWARGSDGRAVCLECHPAHKVHA